MTQKLPPELKDTILHGDCLALLPQLPDESISFTLFSPPYDGIRDYNGDWKAGIIRHWARSWHASPKMAAWWRW